MLDRTLWTVAIVSWLLSVFTGTASGPSYGALITGSIAFAGVHFLAADRLVRRVRSRRWLLALPVGALAVLTADNVGRRLPYTLEQLVREGFFR